MSSCRCCNNKNAKVMALLCDRCFLGWNGDCCPFRIALDQVVADSTQHVCEELGFYQVSFSLQCKRLSRKLKKEKELNERVKIVCKNDQSHMQRLAS